MCDGGGVVAILAALEDGHAEDGVEVGEGCVVWTAVVEELDAGAAILLDALAEAPTIDVDSDDSGVGEVFGEGEGFFASGAAKGEDDGIGSVLEMARAGGEEFGVAVGLGVGGALVVGGAVEEAG